MIEQQEPRTAAEPVAIPPEPPTGRRPLAALLTVAVLVGALAGGGVAAAVTLTILGRQARTNPVSVDLRNHVTISASDAVINVAGKALPAVVSVVTGTSADGSPIAGPGFLVTSDGYVVTGVPVVAGSSKLQVLVPGDSKPHAARLVDYDCQAGFAVLKADGVSGAPTLSFGDSSALKPGETVIALGGPLQGPQVAAAVVASLNSTGSFPDPADPSRTESVAGAVQTSQRLLAGTGGAPLLNVGGQVVGILLPAATGSPSAAVASAMVQPGVQQAVTGSPVSPAGLGATWIDVQVAAAAASGRTAGASLSTVQASGPAGAAGLKAGDVITQVDEVIVDDAHPLALDLRTRFQPGQRVTVTYLRGSTSSQVELTLTSEHPACT